MVSAVELRLIFCTLRNGGEYSVIHTCQKVNSLFPLSLSNSYTLVKNLNNIEGTFSLSSALFPFFLGLATTIYKLVCIPSYLFLHVQASAYKCAHFLNQNKLILHTLVFSFLFFHSIPYHKDLST